MTVTVANKTFPARQLKWREMKQIRNCASADESNAMLYGMMGFADEHYSAMDDMAVGDVHKLQRELFAAACAPTEDEEKN